MTYNIATLPNGLRVIHHPAAQPVVYCGYCINAGTRHEDAGQEGVAHFCEHATFKGTARRRAWNILNCLESVGGDLNAFTNKEDTVYHAAVLKDDIARAVDLLSDIVFFSTYPDSELHREVEVICDEIESYNDSPAELIYDEFENMLFSGHPLGHNILGQSDSVRTYTGQTARTFTQKYYRPSNAVFFAYGDCNFDRLVKLLAKATAAFPDAVPQTGIIQSGATLPEYHPEERTVCRATHQAHVMIGNRAYSVHDERRMPLYLLNNILGGPGMNARLNLSLRERHGLVYSVDSSMVSYSDTGVWCVYFGCDPHDVARCRRLVYKELARLAGAPLSEAQLRAAKKQIKGQIAVACDSRESFALDFGKSYLHYGWQKDIASLLAQIDALTAGRLWQVAKETFAPDRLTTLIYSGQAPKDNVQKL